MYSSVTFSDSETLNRVIEELLGFMVHTKTYLIFSLPLTGAVWLTKVSLPTPDHQLHLCNCLPAPAGQWAIPCDSADTMSFIFGHQNFTLQPSDYLIGPTTGDPNYCLSWPKASAPTGDGLDWQLGSAFLRTVYSVFRSVMSMNLCIATCADN